MVKKQAKEKRILPAKIEKVDDQLVDTALQEITIINHEKTHDVVYSIGECLCRNFYDNDVERIRKNKPVHGKSLNKLMSECGAQISGLSRAWLYTSVNLLVDRKDLQGDEDYGNLSVSHKHALLQVKGVEAKTELISQITADNISVRNAIALTSKYLEDNPKARVTKKKKKKKTFGQVLRQPYLLDDPHYRHFKAMPFLRELSKEEQTGILETITDQLEKTYKRIDQKRKNQPPLGESVRQLLKLRECVENIDIKLKNEKVAKGLQQMKEDRTAEEE